MQNSKILIVDDVSKNIQMAMNILKNEGYKMFYATNGKAALKLIDENDFDLILLDIILPDMNGFEICKEIKKIDRVKDVPIIFLSGKTEPTDIETAYSVGGFDYIIKPFINLELVTKVKNYLRLKELEDIQTKRSGNND